MLVTDAISALGLTEGTHQIGALDIEIKNDCAYILGTETLCGSITPLNRCVKLFDEFCSEYFVFYQSFAMIESAIEVITYVEFV